MLFSRASALVVALINSLPMSSLLPCVLSRATTSPTTRSCRSTTTAPATTSTVRARLTPCNVHQHKQPVGQLCTSHTQDLHRKHQATNICALLGACDTLNIDKKSCLADTDVDTKDMRASAPLIPVW